MTEMIERVAQAMYRANPEHKRRPFHEAERWLQDQARDMARAAIAEMREPTVDMRVADAVKEWPDDAAACWRAMIDAALQAPAPIPHHGEKS